MKVEEGSNLNRFNSIANDRRSKVGLVKRDRSGMSSRVGCDSQPFAVFRIGI